MKTNLNAFIFISALLLWTACSDQSNPSAGTTELPNMGAGSVLCSRGNSSSDSLNANNCYWSAEMWNRTSGYRVHTGFDNGSNTSGIWVWKAEGSNGREARIDWPGNATTDYDSMALADVIDKCHGSLCGTAVFEDMTAKYRNRTFWSESKVSVEFSFAGKNSSGQFDVADGNMMQGLCIEYIGSGMKMELVLGEDSLTGWRESWLVAVELPDFMPTEIGPNQKGKELCYPWNAFVRYAPELGAILPYLQGLRISVNTNDPKKVSAYFDIISLGDYSYFGPIVGDPHPVNSDCEAVSVKDYFCDCSYSDERSVFDGRTKAMSRLLGLLEQTALDTSVFMPNASFECLQNVYRKYFVDSVQTVSSWERPCDNPLPKKFLCSGGFESDSKEFAQVYAEYETKVNVNYEKEKVFVDSIVAQCLSLRDTMGNGTVISDTCRTEELFFLSDLEEIGAVNDASRDVLNEFYDRMDSLNALETLDDTTKSCAKSYALARTSDYHLYQLDMLDKGLDSLPEYKTMRCVSGNVYYTSEYKAFLQRYGIEENMDSLQIYAATKKALLKKADEVFQSCFDSYKKNVHAFDSSWPNVNTGFDDGSGTAGKWFYETDSADGGNSRIDLFYNIDDGIGFKTPDSLHIEDGLLFGSAVFKKGNMQGNPYVNLGFWLAPEDANGVHGAVDISEKQGLCFVLTMSPESLYVQLDMGDSLNTLAGGDLFGAAAKITEADDYKIPFDVCLLWKDFKQSGSGNVVDREDALKHVERVKFHFEQNPEDMQKEDGDRHGFSFNKIYYKNP